MVNLPLARLHEANFAGAEDYALCRRIHRQFGTTYYFASQRFGATMRRRTHAVYAFVRVPDEWVDNPNGMTLAQRAKKLADFRREFLEGLEGVRPNEPVLRAFCDVVREVEMGVQEPLLFLDAMEMDLTETRYDTYEDLRRYMRGSAAAVGLMMCSVLEAGEDPKMIQAAKALGEAMQLTNFLRDVGEDAQRGRIYLPQEDLFRFAISNDEVLEGRISERFRGLMRFEIARARELYRQSDVGIPMLPPRARTAVKLARVLYERILDRIEDRDFDVFSGRARTSKVEKLQVAARVVLGGA
jgi:phytoene synthase